VYPYILYWSVCPSIHPSTHSPTYLPSDTKSGSENAACQEYLTEDDTSSQHSINIDTPNEDLVRVMTIVLIPCCLYFCL